MSLGRVARQGCNHVDESSASAPLILKLGCRLSLERVHTDVFGIDEQSGISVNRVRTAGAIYEQRRNDSHVPKVSLVQVDRERDLAGLGILIDYVSAICGGKLTGEVADLLLEAWACNNGQLSTGHTVGFVKLLKYAVEGGFRLRASSVVSDVLVSGR